MNFWSLYIFMNFILIFQEFLEIKICKKGVYLVQNLCDADMSTPPRGTTSGACKDTW